MRTFVLYILALSQLYTPFTYAAEIESAATFSLTSYENIRRVENPEGDELAETIRLSTRWTENTRNIDAAISAGVETTRFSEEIQDDRNEADLNANIIWVISPNRYEWVLNDIYTHTAVDPRLTNTPLNRQYINSLSTGPNLSWRFSKATYINVEPRIEDYRFENDILNNQRANTRLEWIQVPGSSTKYGIDIFYESTNYTSSSLVNSDYDQAELNINVDYIRRNLSIQATTGFTQINSSNYDSDNKSQYRLYVKNQRTRSSNIELAIGKNVSDTSRTVNSSVVESDITLTTSSDLYTNKYISLSYDKSHRNFNFTLDAQKRDEDYYTQDNLDRKVEYGDFSLQWMNTSNTLFRLGYNITNAEYPLDPNQRLDEDRRGLLEYVYRSNTNLSYILSITDITRDSTVSGASFEDKVLMFSITFATRSRDS